MKKILIVLLTSTFLSSCLQYEKKGVTTSGGVVFDIIVIENCEYIFYSYGDLGMFSHKGNCSNPIHKCENGGIKSY